MAKKNNNYYNMFSDIANDAIFAAHHLDKTVKNYNPEKMEKLVNSTQALYSQQRKSSFLLSDGLQMQYCNGS